MKKAIFIFTALILSAVMAFGQGGFLTRKIEVNFDELNQPPFAALSFADSTVTQSLTEDADTLTFVEDNFSFQGVVYMEGAALSDFAITDEQVPLLDYWAKAQELNKLPAFEGVDRRNVGDRMAGNEESIERLLRYIVDMEARIVELEGKLEE